MKALNYLGVILLLIGAAILIYLGFTGTNQSNTGLIVGLVLVILGFILHILIDRKVNSLPASE